MNKNSATEICNYISSSAKKYYDYLLKNNKGISETAAKKIEKCGEYDFKVYFGEIIKDFDFIREIRFDGKAIPFSQFKFYNPAPLSVNIKVPEKFINLFVTSDKISFVTDYKEFVFRIYKRFNDDKRIQMPSSSPNINFNKDDFCDIKFTEIQLDSINNIFSSPLSYVWGSAGSGKTRYVLSYSILTYLMQNRPVLLCAPTNVALENALYAIIPIAQKYGIPIKKIFRDGTPSSDFFTKYPDCCRNDTNNEKTEKLNNRKRDLEKYCKICDTLNVLSDIENRIEFIKDSESELKRNIDDNEQLTLKANLLQKQIIDCDRDLYYINSIINKKKKSIIYKIKSAMSLSMADDEKLYNLLKELEEKKKITDSNKDILSEYEKQIDVNSKSVKELNSKIKSNEDAIKKQLIPLSKKPLDILNFDRLKQQIKEYRAKNELFIGYINTNYSFLNPDNVKDELKKTDNEIKELTDKIKKEQNEILLYSCTLDCLSSSPVQENYNFSHVFLDEACYTCISKAMLLFYSNAPITFLGDHLQLPPVCEFNDDDILLADNKSLFTWAQSGIYCCDLFSMDFDDCYQKYVQNDPEIPKELSVSQLNETHRFGVLLSKILNKYIYKSDFKSVLKTETEIYIIDAPHKSFVLKKRENIDEAMAIKRFLLKNKIDDFAVLTPYVNQVNLLKSVLPKKYESQILSIHKSQGQEWDTVIISISDTSNRYFTDVNNSASRGKQLLNTAISRTKNRLILVCDAGYWKKLNNQLISELVNIGKIFKV